MTPDAPTPTATGRREEEGGVVRVAFDRTFRAPIEDVWAAATEPERLARWIGTWTGDPRTGAVDFRMLFEGEDHPAELMRIQVCEAPRRLVLVSESPSGSEGEPAVVWHMTLDLVESDGVTTLTFSQSVPSPEWAEGVGPGWDYYLDRLVAAVAGGDPSSVDFADYHPQLAPYYRDAFGDPS